MKYRIYRINENDPFRAPRGWLIHQGQMPMWVNSDEAEDADTYTKDEAETLVNDWNDYYASKGEPLRTVMEEAV